MNKQQDFKTLREAIDDLNKLPSCDLSDGRTDEYEARYVLTKILINMLRCRSLDSEFSSENERKEYVECIKKLTGLNNVIDLNYKFRLKEGTISQALKEQSLDFPISAVFQFLYSCKKNYDLSGLFDRLTQGRWQYSWTAKWLE